MAFSKKIRIDWVFLCFTPESPELFSVPVVWTVWYSLKTWNRELACRATWTQLEQTFSSLTPIDADAAGGSRQVKYEERHLSLAVFWLWVHGALLLSWLLRLSCGFHSSTPLPLSFFVLQGARTALSHGTRCARRQRHAHRFNYNKQVEKLSAD